MCIYFFQCPELIALVYESYIPRVRYGAALALGIACAGTGSREAMAIIEPMTNDNVNYVRRAALIASALIMIQHTEATCPKVKDFRALYAKIITDKHEDVMVKLGAIFAQGIIDAGGRNVTVSLQSRTGHTNMMAVVGMLIFTQYWYWFPLAHFLSLAFTPSCVVALNENLDMPVMGVKSNAKPSTYGYPPPLEEKVNFFFTEFLIQIKIFITISCDFTSFILFIFTEKRRQRKSCYSIEELD